MRNVITIFAELAKLCLCVSEVMMGCVIMAAVQNVDLSVTDAEK